MKINKIDPPNNKKTLFELDPGDLFEYDGRLFIKTNSSPIVTTDILCVVLCSGRA